MSRRRTHSSIDKLPAKLRDALTRMLVDNEWPDDFPLKAAFGFKGTDTKTTMIGTPRYEDLVTYCKHKGFTVSLSAIGRFGMRMRNLARMKNAGVIVRDVMADLTAEKASATQKAVAEIITAQVIEFASESNLSAKEIQNVARAVRDCTAVSINADKYIRDQIKEKAARADKAISTLAKKKKIGPDVLKKIREEIYGIIK